MHIVHPIALFNWLVFTVIPLKMHQFSSWNSFLFCHILWKTFNSLVFLLCFFRCRNILITSLGFLSILNANWIFISVVVKCDFCMERKCDTQKKTIKNKANSKILCVKSTSNSNGSKDDDGGGGGGGSNKLVWCGNEAKCGNSASIREQLMYIYSYVDWKSERDSAIQCELNECDKD